MSYELTDYDQFYYEMDMAPVMCERCRLALPLDGYDNCGKCQAIVEREEALEYSQGAA